MSIAIRTLDTIKSLDQMMFDDSYDLNQLEKSVIISMKNTLLQSSVEFTDELDMENMFAEIEAYVTFIMEQVENRMELKSMM